MDGPAPALPASKKDLATLCAGGDIRAGVQLVERLWAEGREVSMDMLVELAIPTMRVSFVAFDLLADARALAFWLRDPGIEDPD